MDEAQKKVRHPDLSSMDKFWEPLKDAVFNSPCEDILKKDDKSPEIIIADKTMMRAYSDFMRGKHE